MVTQTGKYFKNLLEEKGITHTKIVNRADVSMKTLDIFLNDRRVISEKNLKLIIDAIYEELAIIDKPKTSLPPATGTSFQEMEKIMKDLPEDWQTALVDQGKDLHYLYLRTRNK